MSNIFRDVRRWASEGDWLSVKTTTAYVDHIAEATGAHGIVFNHSLLPNADDTQNVGSDAARVSKVTCKQLLAWANGLTYNAARGYSDTASQGGYLYLDHAGGVYGAATALASGATIGGISCRGWDGNSWSPGGTITIESIQAFTHTPEAHGCKMLFATVSLNGNNPSTKMSLSTGGLSLLNTYDLISDTNLGSDVGGPSNAFGNGYIETLYVDHIKERTGAHTIAVDHSLTMADAINIILNTTTGTKIGTATGQKLAFHNSTPVIQRAGAAQVAPAAYTTGAFGLDSDAKMQAFFDLVVEIRAVLVEKGLMKGAA